MKYLDVHAHLESTRFEKDLDEVIERCRKNQVNVINAGVNPSTNKKIIELKNKYPDVIKISFGLYPIDALAKECEAQRTISKESCQQENLGCLTKEIESGEGDFLRKIESFDIDEELLWIEKNKNECVAIGEIGLDYNYEEIRNSEKLKDKQKDVFRKILELAKKIDKPVIIHSRKAESDAIQILEEIKIKKVVMHCFSGKKSLIKRCIDNGWFLSIPAKITRLEHFKMVVEMTPIQQLLTETDSPLLSPVAGERNEPSNVLITIKEIAKIKNLAEEEARKKILENAKKLFPL
jgi:TatD DNase family protein